MGAQTPKKWDPEKVGPRRMGPRRMGPEGWGPKGWGPEGWGVWYLGQMSLRPDQSSKTLMSLRPNFRRLIFGGQGSEGFVT